MQKYILKSAKRIRVRLKSYETDNQLARTLLLQSFTVISFDK